MAHAWAAPAPTPSGRRAEPVVNTEPILPDVLRSGLRLVFCDTAASAASARARAYYAHPGNLFWPTLHAVGLTPRRLRPEEFNRLPEYGLGLTDVVKSMSGSDAELLPEAFDAEALQTRIIRCQPAYLGFTSKTAAKQSLGLKRVDYGLMQDRLGETRLFVLPSPSGWARGYWDENPWRELAGLAKAIETEQDRK